MTPRRAPVCQKPIGEKTTRQHLADQLSKHGWEWPKTPAGNMQLKRPELQQIMYNLLGI